MASPNGLPPGFPSIAQATALSTNAVPVATKFSSPPLYSTSNIARDLFSTPCNTNIVQHRVDSGFVSPGTVQSANMANSPTMYSQQRVPFTTHTNVQGRVVNVSNFRSATAPPTMYPSAEHMFVALPQGSAPNILNSFMSIAVPPSSLSQDSNSVHSVYPSCSSRVSSGPYHSGVLQGTTFQTRAASAQLPPGLSESVESRNNMCHDFTQANLIGSANANNVFPSATPVLPQANIFELSQVAQRPTSSATVLKLPPFSHDQPRTWFAVVELLLATQGITDDTSRFVALITALHEHLDLLGDLISDPPRVDMFNHVKRVIISRLTVPTDHALRDFLHTAALQDKLPSDLWRRLRSQVDPVIMPDAALWPLWLLKMPIDIQMQLLPRATDPIDERLRLADATHRLLSSRGLTQAQPHPLGSALPPPPATASAVVPQLLPASQQQPAPSSPHCYYHAQFGAEARKCRKPCSYPNASGRPA